MDNVSMGGSFHSRWRCSWWFLLVAFDVIQKCANRDRASSMCQTFREIYFCVYLVKDWRKSLSVRMRGCVVIMSCAVVALIRLWMSRWWEVRLTHFYIFANEIVNVNDAKIGRSDSINWKKRPNDAPKDTDHLLSTSMHEFAINDTIRLHDKCSEKYRICSVKFDFRMSRGRSVIRFEKCPHRLWNEDSVYGTSIHNFGRGEWERKNIFRVPFRCKYCRVSSTDCRCTFQIEFIELCGARKIE